MDEKIDILDASGNPTGRVAWKSEAHRRGLWHRCFHCWISGTDSEGRYLLVQRRAAVKDTWPGRLDVTAAGHLAAGETTLDGLRELDEELGLTPDPELLIPLGTRRIEQEIPDGRDCEFHEVFLLLDQTPPEEMSLQEEEVDSLVRIALENAEKLDVGETVPAREWKDGERVETRVSLADFVPNDDGYLGRVALAARKALAGEQPRRIF
ncbi:MAG: NUDIX hydrolase [Rubrobacteraceae bacterium]